MGKWNPRIFDVDEENVKIINEFYPDGGISSTLEKTHFLSRIALEIGALRDENERLKRENERMRKALEVLEISEEKIEFEYQAGITNNDYEIFVKFSNWVTDQAIKGLNND